MVMSYEETQPLATDEALAEVEDRLGVVLPAEFRDHLRTVGNGGRVHPSVILAEVVGQVGVISLLGVPREDDLDLERRALAYAGRLPHGFLPIADAEGGNLILTSTRPADAGSIWFWDHEEEAEESQPADLSNMTRLADDFLSFSRAAVHAAELKEEDLPRQVRVVWIDPDFLPSLEQPPE